MQMLEYYAKTLSTAGGKIGSLIAFLIMGYFIFFKLPLLFFVRNMKKSKEELGIKNEEPAATPPQKAYSVEDYERFRNRKKRMDALPANEKAAPKKEEPLRLGDGTKKTEERSKDFAENIFELRQGATISKEELKKKYHELLRQNHPDKVASLSPEFRALADKRTKDINDAYNKLLKRAV